MADPTLEEIDAELARRSAAPAEPSLEEIDAELARRSKEVQQAATPAPQPPPPEAPGMLDAISHGWTQYVQQPSLNKLNEMLTPHAEAPQNHAYSPSDLVQNTNAQQAANQLGDAQLFKAINPSLWGSEGQKVLEGPNAQTLHQLAEQGGIHPWQLTAQKYAAEFAPWLAGGGLLRGLGAAGEAAPAAIESGSKLWNVGKAALHGAAAAAGFGAVAGLAGGPEGGRAQEAIDTAKNPLNLAMGAGLGGAGGLIAELLRPPPELVRANVAQDVHQAIAGEPLKAPPPPSPYDIGPDGISRPPNLVDFPKQNPDARIPQSTGPRASPKVGEPLYNVKGEQPGLSAIKTNAGAPFGDSPDPTMNYRRKNAPAEPAMSLPSGEDVASAHEEALQAAKDAHDDPRTAPVPQSMLPGDGKFPADAVPSTAYLQELQNHKELAASQPSTGAAGKIARALAQPEDLAPIVESDAIRQIKAAQKMNETVFNRIYPLLRKTVNKAVKAGDVMTQKFTTQRVSPELIRNPGDIVPVEGLPQAVQNIYGLSVADMKAKQAELAAAGYFKPGTLERQVEMEKVGLSWLHRDYLANMFPGRYAPSPFDRLRAVEWIQKNTKIDGNPLSMEQASHEFDRFMAAPDTAMSAWKGSPLNGNILKERGNLPPALAKARGPINDPAYVMAASMAEQTRMHHYFKVSGTYTAPEYKGILWDDNQFNPKMALKQIPMDKSKFGEFAGKWLAPHLDEVVRTAPQPLARNAVMDMVHLAVRSWRAAHILQSLSFLTHWMSHTQGLASNGLHLANPMTYWRVGESVSALSKYRGMVVAPEITELPPASSALRVQMAHEDGAISPGAGLGNGVYRRVSEQFLHQNSGGLAGLGHAALNVLEKINNGMSHVYEYVGSATRLMAYNHQLERLVKSGATLADARAGASRMVNRYFVTGANAAPIVQQLQRNLGGIAISPVAAFHADALRVARNLVEDGTNILGAAPGAASQNSSSIMGPLINLGIVAGAFKGLQMMHGISDAEIAAAEKMLSPGDANHYPVHQFMPSKDEEGRMWAVSTGSLSYFSNFLQGEDPNLFVRAASNTGTGFFNPSMAGPTINHQLNLMGVPTNDFQERPPLPGEAPMAFLKQAWSNGIESGLIKKMAVAARRSRLSQYMPDLVEPLRRHEEAYTPAQAALSFTPFTPLIAGERGSEGERVQTQGVNKGLQRNQKTINKRESIAPEDKPELRAASFQALQQSQAERAARYQILLRAYQEKQNGSK